MKYINKLAVFTISVLTANLLSIAIFDAIISLRKNSTPFMDTLIGMAIIVFVFYPIMKISEQLLVQLTDKYLKKSKKVVKSNSLGIFIGIFSAYFILYYFYLKSWYSINLFKALF